MTIVPAAYVLTVGVAIIAVTSDPAILFAFATGALIAVLWEIADE